MGKRIPKEQMKAYYKLLGKDNLRKSGYTKEELEELIILGDPVKWCSKYLCNPQSPDKPIEIRWYQEEMLNDDSTLRTARIGRQAGKTVTLCMDMLWSMATEPDYQVILLVPFKEHINTIRETINQLIANSDDLMTAIKSMGKDPYRIEWHNGSTMRAFAVARNPAKARGANASAIYIDEVDYIPTKIIEELISGYMQSRKDVKIWASSTPSGAREWFYNIHQSDEWSKYHYPSMVNPNWDDELEARLKTMITTQTAWLHEIEAEFGDLEGGMFKNEDIDACIEKGLNEKGSYVDKVTSKKYYTYKDCVVDEKANYIIGVDWNGPKHGIQILVCNVVNPLDVVVVDRISIDSKEHEQLKAVKKIIEVDKIYKPERIYVDQGYGSTQIQLLDLFAKHHKDARLEEKIVPVDFSEQIELEDPFTGNKYRRYRKDVMLDNAVRYIEMQWVTLPKEEDKNGGLVNQLRNFEVVGWSAGSNKPKYSEGNDHILDPLIMILYGVMVEKTTFYTGRKVELTTYPTVNTIETKIGKEIVQRAKISKVDARVKNAGIGELSDLLEGFNYSTDRSDPDHNKSNMINTSPSVTHARFTSRKRHRKIVPRRIR